MAKAAHAELTRILRQRSREDAPPDTFEQFMAQISEGDRYLLYQEEVGIEHDNSIDDPLVFTVSGFSKHTCEATRENPINGNIHRINLGYNTMYVYKIKGRKI